MKPCYTLFKLAHTQWMESNTLSAPANVWLALDNQLVESPYRWGVDVLSDLKDIFIFWDFLLHVSSIVIPSPFYSPNEHLQNKGGSQDTMLYVLRRMREWWRVSGVRKENQADSRGSHPSPGWRDRLWWHSLGGRSVSRSRREMVQKSPYAFILLLSVPMS